MLQRAAIGPAGLLLTGPAGIGKSTLWRAAMAEARGRGFRVLETRAVEAEARLGFGGLADLFGEVIDDLAASLPAGQRHAVDLALQRVPAEGREPAPLAVSLGILGILRALAVRGPVVVAVDDLPWLDASSARVLEYLLRRLEGEPVCLLASMRTERTDASLPPAAEGFSGPMEHMHVGPLDMAATAELIERTFDATFRRPALARIHAESGGNPFFALEIALALRRTGGDVGLGVLELPAEMGELVGDRLDALPRRSREPLAAIAALAQPTRELIDRAFPDAADSIRVAVESGVLEAQPERLRFTHPLLAAAAYGRLEEAERRRLHRRLADVAPDAEQRARHLALASAEPSEDVAAQLEAAAGTASARGATEMAADLAGEAVARTPTGDLEARRRRAIAAAGYFVRAGDPTHARRLLEEIIDALPPGPERGEVLMALADVRSADDWREKHRLLDQALEEAGSDDRLRSAVFELRSQCRYHLLVDAAGSLSDARQALEAARRQSDPAVLCSALMVAGFAQGNTGMAVEPELLEEALGLQSRVEHLRVFLWPAFTAALVDLDHDRLEEASTRLSGLRERAALLGDWDSFPFIAIQQAWAALGRGAWPEALQHADEAEQIYRQNGQATGISGALAIRGMLLASLGRGAEALAAAAEGIEIAERIGVRLFVGLHRATRGMLALAGGDHSRAESELREAIEPSMEAGYLESYTTDLTPDWAEALIHLGRAEDALALVGPYEARAQRDARHAALAACARVRGLAAAAAGNEMAALTAFSEALRHHASVDLPFERARTLLAQGETLRRFRQRGAARGPLAEALEIFSRLHAARWRERAAAELARTGHRETGDDLTPTERQVADLVAAGRTNREVAEQLFMSPHTVEAHLTRIYRSLGLRRRAELARVWTSRRSDAAEE